MPPDFRAPGGAPFLAQTLNYPRISPIAERLLPRLPAQLLQRPELPLVHLNLFISLQSCATQGTLLPNIGACGYQRRGHHRRYRSRRLRRCVALAVLRRSAIYDRFLCQASAAKLVAKGLASLLSKEVNVEQLGPQLHHVSVFLLVPYFHGEAPFQEIRAYGKPADIDYVPRRGRPNTKTGTRIVRLTMIKSVPNFIVIQSNRVMMEHHGIQRAGSR